MFTLTWEAFFAWMHFGDQHRKPWRVMNRYYDVITRRIHVMVYFTYINLMGHALVLFQTSALGQFESPSFPKRFAVK